MSGVAHTIGFMADDNPPVQRFLTAEQVADILNVSALQVRALLRSGELRGFQMNRGIWRIGAADIENYIEAAYMKTAERIAAGDLQNAVTAED